MNVFDVLGLQGQANTAATDAASAALDNLAQRPFSVVVSVAPDTRQWLSLLALGISLSLLLSSRRKARA